MVQATMIANPIKILIELNFVNVLLVAMQSNWYVNIIGVCGNADWFSMKFYFLIFDVKWEKKNTFSNDYTQMIFKCVNNALQDKHLAQKEGKTECLRYN